VRKKAAGRTKGTKTGTAKKDKAAPREGGRKSSRVAAQPKKKEAEEEKKPNVKTSKKRKSDAGEGEKPVAKKAKKWLFVEVLYYESLDSCSTAFDWSSFLDMVFLEQVAILVYKEYRWEMKNEFLFFTTMDFINTNNDFQPEDTRDTRFWIIQSHRTWLTHKTLRLSISVCSGSILSQAAFFLVIIPFFIIMSSGLLRIVLPI